MQVKDSITCARAFAHRDDGWMKFRVRNVRGNISRTPVNVYSVVPSLWRKRNDGTPSAFSEIATELACYVKQMGFTHVELLCAVELGENGARLLPTSVCGSEHDFSRFVDSFHEAGIGVLISVRQKDIGTSGGFSTDPDRLLQSELIRWAEAYHVDGFWLRGVWPDGKNRFSDLAVSVQAHISDVLLFWDAQTGDENSFSPLPFLEKETPKVKSIDGKPAGSSAEKVRFGYLATRFFQKAVPMGWELATWPENAVPNSPDWYKQNDPRFAAHQLFCAAVNHFYLENPMVSETVCEQDYGENNRAPDVFSYHYRSFCDREIYAVANFSTSAYKEYELCVLEDGEYEEVLNSDHPTFGGNGVLNRTIFAEPSSVSENRVIRITVPPLALCTFRRKATVKIH